MERRRTPDDTSPTLHTRKGWKWADGKIHPEPPPSAQSMQIDWVEEVTGDPKTPVPKPVSQTSPIPLDWKPDARYALRMAAFDFVLRTAILRGDTKITGAELCENAEHLERWLSGTDKCV